MQLQDTTLIHQSSAQSPSQHYNLLQHQQQQHQQGTRVRSVSSSIHHSPLYSSTTTASGGIRKKRSTPISSSRHRAVSTSYAERLHHIALEQSIDADFSALHSHQQQSNSLNWLTPQQSPEPSCFFQEPVQLELGQFQWAAPTPPRSDSGIPTLPADTAEESLPQQQSTCSGVSSPEAFAFDQVTAASDMSSLGFLLPQHYASASYSSETNTSSAPSNGAYSMDNGYPARTHATTNESSQYSQTISSSPSLYSSRAAPAVQRRQSGLPAPNYAQLPYDQTRRMTGSYDSPATNDYSMPQTSGMPLTTASPMASPPAPAYSSSYRPHESTPRYDTQQYYASTYTTAPAGSHVYAPASSSAYPSSYPSSSADAGRLSNGSVRSMSSSKPKPQCWDHGCNGRQFSTFSNLLRHQREKSGTATKSYCPKCGAEFTRTTARNGHLAHDKCTKGRPLSEGQV